MNEKRRRELEVCLWQRLERSRSPIARRPTGFPAELRDSQHLRIPPTAHTYQSDVETVHRLEEDEFFDLETFSSRGHFLAKVHTYQLYFNLARPNSHKDHQTPWQIVERLAPRLPLQLCLLPRVFLDYYLNDSGGYDVGRLSHDQFSLDRSSHPAYSRQCLPGPHPLAFAARRTGQPG